MYVHMQCWRTVHAAFWKSVTIKMMTDRHSPSKSHKHLLQLRNINTKIGMGDRR